MSSYLTGIQIPRSYCRTRSRPYLKTIDSATRVDLPNKRIRELLPDAGGSLFTVSNIPNNLDPVAIDYGASKAAIVYMVRSLAIQLVDQGIRVNSVAPAITYTPFLATGGFSADILDEVAKGYPFGRIEQPGELAPLYVDLADPLGTFTSGTIHAANGAVPGPF